MSEQPEVNCGFNRFMDAAVGTNWRRTVSGREAFAVLKAWNRESFKGLRWDEIREKVTEIRRLA